MPGFQGDHYMSGFGPENSVQKKVLWFITIFHDFPSL